MDDYAGTVRVIRHDGWAELVLNRPERRNALVGPQLELLTATLETLGADDTLAAIVFRGEGGAFCSGHDLTVLQSEPRPPWAANLAAIFRRTNIALFEFPKPIIGALEKCAINAGAALALSCDILIAGETAFLQVGEIQQGAGIANNAAWLRLRVGESAAARIVFYGDRVGAAELRRLGLVAELVPDAGVVARACEVAERLAGFPAGAPARHKAALRAQSGIADPHAWFREQSSNALLSAGRVRG
ncbi:MAG: enoyl-CoA hydratase/isomerase family protein [Hyphomicrobiales bacterium]